MANRGLLHRSKLEPFAAWLVARGWTLEERDPMPAYQALRARSPGWTRLLVVYDRESGDHLSVQRCDQLMVRRFLKETQSSQGASR